MSLNTITLFDAFQEENKNILKKHRKRARNLSYNSMTCATSWASDLKGNYKKVFELFYSVFAKKRSVFFSQDWVAEQVGCDERHVRRILRYFSDLGYITWLRRLYSSNLYLIAPEFLMNEVIRTLKDVFPSLRSVWFNLLLFSTINPDLLEAASTRQKEENVRLYYSSICIKRSYRINRISIVEGIRAKMNDDGKKIGEAMNEERKVVFEALEKNGLRFNEPAQAELSMFNDGTLLKSASRFIIAAKKSTISNPWGYFITIAKQIATESGQPIDRVYASTIRTKMGIADTDKRTLEYAPVASDNNTEDSQKKVSDSGKLTDSIPDESGRVKGIMKDGAKVKSRSYQNDFRKHARNPVDLPVFEIPNPKRDYANPGESPQAIRMNMMNYSQSQAYQTDCERDGKEYTDAQINLWLKVANLEEAGNYEKSNEIRGEILGNIEPKLAIFRKMGLI